MAWIAVDKDGTETIFEHKPGRYDDWEWLPASSESCYVEVPRCTAEKLTGSPMSWEDEPRELK